CWHPEAPGLKERKRALARAFASTGPLTVKGLQFERFWARDDEARVDVSVSIEGVEKKSGKQHHGLDGGTRTLELVREDGEWKIRVDQPTIDYYTDLYLRLDDPAERRGLLVQERGRVDVMLLGLNRRIFL